MDLRELINRWLEYADSADAIAEGAYEGAVAQYNWGRSEAYRHCREELISEALGDNGPGGS